MADKDHLHVVFQSDNKFAVLAGTAMISICENNREEKIIFYILNNGITKENRKKLRLIAEGYRCQLNFISIQYYIEKIKNVGGGGLTPYKGVYSIYMKVFLGDCFAEDVCRLLYLDCDIIVNGKLRSLWDTDLGKCSMGMAIDCMNTKLKAGYGIGKGGQYFNTGVILYDLTNWRKNKAKNKFMAFVEVNHKNYLYADQDCMNLCLQNEIFTLPMQYNYLSIYSAFRFADVKYIYGFDTCDFYSFEAFQKAKKHPVIIHYTSVFLGRPWYKDCWCRETGIFNKYLYHVKNPWHNYKKERSKITVLARLQRILYRIVPKAFFVKIQKYASDINTWLVLQRMNGNR